MTAMGMVASASAGRIRCRSASKMSHRQMSTAFTQVDVADELEGVLADAPHLVERLGNGAGRELARRGQLERGAVELLGEHVLQDQTQHEHGDGHPEVGADDGGHVGLGAVARARQHPQRHADDHGDEQRRRRQLQRHRQPLDQQVGDGLAQADRLAEVAGEHVADVAAELHDHRVVEPVALVEVGACASGVARSCNGLARVAGDDVR